jgi:hypothetical protein
MSRPPIIEIKRTVKRGGVVWSAVAQSPRGTKFPYRHVKAPRDLDGNNISGPALESIFNELLGK